jgi:hypothetical protein
VTAAFLYPSERKTWPVMFSDSLPVLLPQPRLPLKVKVSPVSFVLPMETFRSTPFKVGENGFSHQWVTGLPTIQLLSPHLKVFELGDLWGVFQGEMSMRLWTELSPQKCSCNSYGDLGNKSKGEVHNSQSACFVVYLKLVSFCCLHFIFGKWRCTCKDRS